MSGEMQPHYYMNIPAFVWDDKDLLKKPKAILLYGHIATLANKKGYCWATNEYFMKCLGVSRRAVINYINLLTCKGYIKRKNIYKGKTKQVDKRIISICTTPSELACTTYGERECTTPSELACTDNNTRNNNTSINNKKDILSSSHSTVSHSADYKTIVDYLNQKAGTNYRSTSKKTQRLINARFNNDDATVDDFKKVIDIKVSQWKNDDKMSKYLRPETLFGTKFESYLNERPKGKADSKSIDGIDWKVDW